MYVYIKTYGHYDQQKLKGQGDKNENNFRQLYVLLKIKKYDIQNICRR